MPLQWRHNGRHDVSNHLLLDCLLNRLSGRTSKITKLGAHGLCEGGHRWWPMNSITTGQQRRNCFHLVISSSVIITGKVNIVKSLNSCYTPVANVSLSFVVRRGLHSENETIYFRARTGYRHLIHRGRDKMAPIFQTTSSNTFSWMKMHKILSRFHWSLFPRVQLTIFQHWSRQWLGAVQLTSRYLEHWWLVH